MPVKSLFNHAYQSVLVRSITRFKKKVLTEAAHDNIIILTNMFIQLYIYRV